MMKSLRLLAALGVLFMYACSSPEVVEPANVINSSTGVKIELEWSTGGTVSQSIADADLDLYVYSPNGNLHGSSLSVGSFEKVDLASSANNGTYDIAVNYYSGSKRVDYKVIVTSMDGSKSVTKESFFPAAESGTTVRPFKVIKLDNKFTVE
jgi:hypothetical protein